MTVNFRPQLSFKNISASKGFTFLTYTFNRLSPCSCIDLIQNRKTNCNSISIEVKYFFSVWRQTSVFQGKRKAAKGRSKQRKTRELKHFLYLKEVESDFKFYMIYSLPDTLTAR